MIPVWALVLWIYSTVGLGAGAAFFSYDTHKDYDSATTGGLWGYLIGMLLGWPIAGPVYIVETYAQQKIKQVSQEQREQEETVKWEQRNSTQFYVSDIGNGHSYVKCESCNYHFNWKTSDVSYFAQKHSYYEHSCGRISTRRD